MAKTSERAPRLMRDEDIAGAALDVTVINDTAIQIWPWEAAPPEIREGWKEPFPLLAYIPERYVTHPFVRALFGRLDRRREEGDGAIVIAFDWDLPL